MRPILLLVAFSALIQMSSVVAQDDRLESRKTLLRAAFKDADRDSDGRLSAEELTAIARPILPTRLIEQVDVDKDGALSSQEFENALSRLSTPSLPRRQAAAEYEPIVKAPAFAEGKGPVVLLDEAHFNFHTSQGRYAPFVKLLRRDGYVVRPNLKPFSLETLQDASVLVIANAIAEQNEHLWQLPTPSAFTEAEISAVAKWVDDGGALLLIADHMPFAGAADKLADALGARFLNGFVLEAKLFDRRSGQLGDHIITRGRNQDEYIDSISTFTGSAFQIDDGFQPILTFGPDVVSMQPQVAWQFTDDTPREDVTGWCQAAVRRLGNGRVAVFGEAAMFSAQVSAQGRQFGLNSPEAAQNGQLLLNTLHWLTGVLQEP
ncbi:MAG: DUF4350 domain-containing protein [bacterium]|nr:DUF4350 domain-containing protein [bacterium]